MFMEILKMLIVLVAIAGYNSRPAKVTPRYWANINIDSVAQVAERKTDSATSVYVYQLEMKKLNEELK